MVDSASRQGVRFTPAATRHLWQAWRQFRTVGAQLAVIPQVNEQRRYGYGGDSCPDLHALADDLNGHEFVWYVDEDRWADLRSAVFDVSSDGVWLVRAD
jgi:hypothetical protein